MRQEFFKEIGKLSIKEENCSEEEINRICNLVMEKKHYEKNSIIKKRIKRAIISLATAAAIVCVCVCLMQNINVKKDYGNQVVQNTTDAAIIVEQNNRIAVSVYAAKNKNQVVTKNYAKELTMKKVRAGEKTNIGRYSPLSGSVPGYPFVVKDEEQKNSGQNIKIKIETDGGSLLSWNSQTGDVKDKGKSAEFNLDETVYWSPLEHGKLPKEVNLKITMYEDAKIAEETFFHIYEEQEACYVIERLN